MNNNSNLNNKYISKIIENNKQISKLLKENEDLLKKAGYNPPAINLALNNDQRIRFPARYIRDKNYFIKKYHLNEFFKNTNAMKNVAYSLQMSDMYNFIANRFNIYGSIQAMLYKAAIINCVSVIESMVGQVLDDVYSYCKNCPQRKKCKFHFQKSPTFSKKLEAIREYNMLRLEEDDYNKLREIFHLRNHIHIYTAAKENELTNKTFDNTLHNGAIEIMKMVSDNLYNYVLPGTTQCYKDFQYSLTNSENDNIYDFVLGDDDYFL